MGKWRAASSDAGASRSVRARSEEERDNPVLAEGWSGHFPRWTHSSAFPGRRRRDKIEEMEDREAWKKDWNPSLRRT